MAETEEKTFTQDEVNEIVSERLKKAEKKYGDYDELKSKVGEYEQQLADLKSEHEKEINDLNTAHESQINDLNSKVSNYELNSVKMKVALENGLPYDLADRLQGTTEDEIRQDASKLAEFAKPQTAPQYDPEPATQPDQKKAALSKMLADMKN